MSYARQQKNPQHYYFPKLHFLYHTTQNNNPAQRNFLRMSGRDSEVLSYAYGAVFLMSLHRSDLERPSSVANEPKTSSRGAIFIQPDSDNESTRKLTSTLHPLLNLLARFIFTTHLCLDLVKIKKIRSFLSS